METSNNKNLLNLKPYNCKVELPLSAKVIDHSLKSRSSYYNNKKIRVQSCKKVNNPNFFKPKSMLDIDITDYIENRNFKTRKQNEFYLKTETSNNERTSTKQDEAYMNTAFNSNSNENNLLTYTQGSTINEDNHNQANFTKKQFSYVSMNRIIEIIKLKEDFKLEQFKKLSRMNDFKEIGQTSNNFETKDSVSQDLRKLKFADTSNKNNSDTSAYKRNISNQTTDQIQSITDKRTSKKFKIEHVSKMVKVDNPLKDYVVKLEEKIRNNIKMKVYDDHPENEHDLTNLVGGNIVKITSTDDEESQHFEYNLNNLKIEYFPKEVKNILKHQHKVFQGLFRNKTEFYDYINACENKVSNHMVERKVRGIFSQTEVVNKTYKINCKDSKKALQKKALNKKEKILKVFRNGIEQYELNPDPFLQRKHFFLAKNPLPTIRSVRRKEESFKGKINYLNEMFLKTANWIKTRYLPISTRMSKLNKQHVFALGRENELRFGEEFQIAERKKFDEKFRSYPNLVVDDKFIEINRLINQLTDKNRKLDDEVFFQVNDEANNIKYNEFRLKQNKWMRCVISAAIHFKRLNCTIQEFFSESFKISKPYAKSGSWFFFQAVKNNDEELLFKLLYENKFLVHDFDYHKQTGLHWAAKRNFSNLIPVLINFGAKVDFQDSSGRTPLHYAALHNHMESVIVLLKDRADPLISDDLGKTPSQLTTNESINYYLKRIKALFIIYSNASKKEADEKIKRGIDFVFQHESLRIHKEKQTKTKKMRENKGCF